MNRLLFSLIIIFSISIAQDSSKIVYDESFDPFKLHDEEKYFFEALSIDEILEKLDREDLRKVLPQDSSSILRNRGYRVQLFSTSDYRLADSLFYMVENDFEQKVYLIFDAPNYKLRVGDCTTRDEAEKLYNLAIKKGYRHAWIVRSVVYKSASLRKSSP